MAHATQNDAASNNGVVNPDVESQMTDNQSGQDNENPQPVENTFSITIRLPHPPHKTQTIVSTQDQAQDVRQSIIDLPHTSQYSCFHLEYDGQRIPDFVDLAEIPEIKPDVVLTLVEDPYTEKDARLHFLRIRDLIGATGDRTDTARGIQSGLSLHDAVAGGEELKFPANGQAPKKEKDGASRSDKPVAEYDIDAMPGFEQLLQNPVESAPQSVRNISLSSWNPPPYHLRSKGHLLYLLVTTLEGEQFHITSHNTGFYVNKSSSNKFDPTPKTIPRKYTAHSLLTLLTQVSPAFEAAFKELQDFNATKDPLTLFQPTNAMPASPWVVSSANAVLSTHTSDPCRSQETYLIGGAENTESLRDWNEEFQTTKELPKETVQDRVFRERVTSKLFADYNEAAVQGATLIARGEVAPLNPTEPEDAHIFVYNNIFYSFGADGVGTFASEGGDEAARVATGKDVMGVKTVNQMDINDLSTPGTVIVDFLGRRIVAQSIVPGIFKQREPGEQQIDYGGVEGRESVAKNEAFVPLFGKLSSALRIKKHPIWDKEGARHDLEASIETKGLLGTDGRKYVLDLYRITPVDVDWIERHWDAVEKETGETPRYPHRMTVLRPELVDTYWRLKLREYVKEEVAKKGPQTNGQSANGESNGEPKPEGQNETAAEAEKDKDASDQATESEQNRVDISGFNLAFNPDVFSGQQPQTEEEKAQWAKDEEAVRAISTYLLDEVIPKLITDLREGDVGFPMDGQSLSSLLHKRGINIRYLGKIASLSDNSQPRMGALKRLAIREMASRAFKHVFSKYTRRLPPPFAVSCVSHLLNCFLGSKLNQNPTSTVDKELRSLYQQDKFDFESVQPADLLIEIEQQILLRFRYSLPEDWVLEIQNVQMLREISMKLGLQLIGREYHFDTTSPVAFNGFEEAAPANGSLAPPTNGNNSSNSKKKRKNAERASPNRAAQPEETQPAQTFHPDDILNVVPVMKEASPRSALAEEALEAGRISVAQNQKDLGQELLLESLSLHEQIYGILHPEVARVYYQLSSLFYSLDDKSIAVELARKAVIVSERTLGVDSAETVLSYLNLSLFEHATGNTTLALTYIKHALDVWKLVYGTRHPDAITTLNNAAVMLQHLKLYKDSRSWFEASLTLCQQVSGPSSINTATLLFQLAQALALDSDSKGAVVRMREAYNIFNSELGPNDRNTKEAETWLEQLTQNAVSIAKHAKDVQARRMRRLNQLTPRFALGARPSPQLGQPGAALDATDSAVDAATRVGDRSNGGVRLDERSVDELLKYIEGGDAGKTSTPKKRTANPKRRQQRAA